jgi:hypothetical protein
VVAGSIEMNKIEDVIFIEVEELNREKWCKLKKKYIYNYNQLKDKQIILMLMAKKTIVSATAEEADATKTLD